MKLLSATVRNYRIHREVSVDFDASRTLIGGPNEVGKSTLIEAIHRALFLKSTVTGEARKRMVSARLPGHPEVEIRFLADGDEYHLTKRFSGGNGATRLVRVGGAAWQGEEAEARLARLLGVEEAGGGRGILDRLARQWAHLWVWQGMSGDDPAVHALSQQTELLQQLQETGGTVAMQSELDGKVAARFARARQQSFVRGGAAKKGSDLEVAQTELQQAEAEHDAAVDRLGRLQQAVSDYEAAESTLERTVSDLEELRKQRQALNDRMSRAEHLQRLERERTGSVESVKEKVRALDEAEQSLAGLRHGIAELQAALTPKQDRLSQGEARVADLRKRVEEAERAHERSQAVTRLARLRRDLASAYLSALEKRVRTAEIEQRLGRVHALRKELERLRHRLSELPSLEREHLERLQGIEAELGQARAALNAMAAEVEVISADRAVRVGEDQVVAGGSRTIAEATDLTVGDTVRLRIHPGGGDSLGQARERVRSLRDRLRTALDTHSIDSVARASETVAVRSELQGKIVGARAALEELDADRTEADYHAAKDERTAAEAEVARRLDQVKDVEAPETLADAKALRDKQDESVQDAEADEGGLKAARDALRQQAAELDEELKSLREGIAVDQRSLTGFEAQLILLLDRHGDDAARAKAVAESRAALARAESELARTQKALHDLQPELLESDRDRLERSVTEANRQREDAGTAKAVIHSILRSDGSDDPQASLARAASRLDAAREHLEAVNRKAMAVALVDDLFQQQQQALADRFSQPLADRITGYLQCLFGADARAVVRFEDNAFKAIQFLRSSRAEAVAFDALSGGTREQVAAAVRLAIAELLAAEHEGALPVVFDDAFAYSDPERVQVLQRMLDLGATRGLQIIVLTCNPSDYAALGARQVILSPESPQEPLLTETPSAEGGDSATAADAD